ncbi:hypothetical protein IAT40_007677 [Kwoniella sp. CBS 6097]
MAVKEQSSLRHDDSDLEDLGNGRPSTSHPTATGALEPPAPPAGQDGSLRSAMRGLSLQSKEVRLPDPAASDRPTSPFSTYAPSSSASASSTEINDQLTPLPTGYANQDRPALIRKASLPSNIYHSPTLLSLSELMVSPPIPDDSSECSQSYFPAYSNHALCPAAAGNNVPAYPSSAPRTPSDHGLPPKAASDSGTFISAKRSNRSPRIRNTDSVLAPHGSFTSARARSSTISSRASTVSSRSGPNSSPGARSNPQDTSMEMDPKERERLFKAASKGDQLAMHRLGWRPSITNHRHTLGATGDVWGASLSPTVGTRRSSASSQASGIKSPDLDAESSTYMPSPTATSTPSREHSDLFSDAVNLTLQSNARSNRRRPEPPPSSPKDYIRKRSA